MKKTLLFFSSCLLAFASCKKVAGPSGNSAISGTIVGADIGNAPKLPEHEITTIICTHANGIDGSILDNSDYFLLNTPNNGTLYYVWYENTNWPGQDPSLTGRTGIKVTYSNSQSNVVIAQNTSAAINTIAGADFTATVYNDIVTVTNVTPGEVTDADDVNTPFVIDVSNQGKDAEVAVPVTEAIPLAEERIYLIYGEDDFYSESVRTDANGNYQFKGLARGKYRVYAFSKIENDPNNAVEMKTVEVEITQKKTVVSAPQISVLK